MNVRDNTLAVLRRESPERVPLLIDGDVMPRGAFERRLRNKGLGISIQRNEYWLQQDVVVEIHSHGELTEVTYHTPIGNISSKVRTRFVYGMQPDSIDHMVKKLGYMVKTEEEYDAAIYIIEHTVVHIDETPFLNAECDIGEDGVVIGSKVETPYEALKNFLGAPRESSKTYNHSKKFQKLLQAYERKTEEICKALADSPSEIVLIGSIREPQTREQFCRYYLPHFRKYAKMMHQKGKIVGVRARSLSLKSVASLIPQAGLDFIEAFTPLPAGDLSLSEARALWGDRTVIWVNLPETVFTRGAEETYRCVSELICSDAPGDRLIIDLIDLGSSISNLDVVREGLAALTDAVNNVGVCPVKCNNNALNISSRVI